MQRASREGQAKILIVDDHAAGLTARRAVLEEIGHSVHCCSAPVEALEYCGSHPLDLVVTDYRMPGMNGVEFIRELRTRGFTMPIILISGFSETLGFSKENTGADIILQKSAHEVSQLVRAVARLTTAAPRKPPRGRTSEHTRKPAKHA